MHVILYYHDGYLLLFDVDVVYKFWCYQENNSSRERENGLLFIVMLCPGVVGFLIVYKRASIVIRCSKGINGSGNWFAALKLVLLCMVGKLVLGLIWIYGFERLSVFLIKTIIQCFSWNKNKIPNKGRELKKKIDEKLLALN